MRHAAIALALAALAPASAAQAQLARFCDGRFLVEGVDTASTVRSGRSINSFVFRLGNATDQSLPYRIQPQGAALRTSPGAGSSGTLAPRQAGLRVWAVEEQLGPEGGPTRAPTSVAQMLTLIQVDCSPWRSQGGRP